MIRAVTYGPFPPEANMETRAELEKVRVSGATHLRLYEEPSEKFLGLCEEAGLRLILTLPWTQHIDFVAAPEYLEEAKALLQTWVRRWRENSIITAYLVGNEIPAQLVRWIGPAEVQQAIESLIDAGRQADPNALFAYASYPTTEYLIPRNQDFFAFNIYLEERQKFADYLRRLRHLSGRKPLLITEFGVDSLANGMEKQAEILDWHFEEICRAGVAGTTVFAWSDLWWRGGKEITGWDFGLQSRDGSAKPAGDSLSKKWAMIESSVDGVVLKDPPPNISVIVCTYCGSATLGDCLRSLTKLCYSGVYEVLLINDGGDVAVEQIAGEFSEVRYFSVEHGGLSVARNVGAAQAEGDIFVYLDDDCIAPPDWLMWLALEYEIGEWGAVGGPNYPPPATSWIRAAVAAAPGGPSHVMLTDREAEHIPGCNLSVRREAFEKIGGFDAQFRTAGDDVDFCWRVQDAGWKIGFHPEAWVWHHRRFSISAFFRQQCGYGRAEALLLAKHPEKHGATGGVRWRGVIYAESGGSGQSLDNPGARIYQGEFGNAPFQRIYGGDLSTELGPGSLPQEFDLWKTRVLVRLLGFLQPIARAWAWWRASARRPAWRQVLRWRRREKRVKRSADEVYELWSTREVGRDELLSAIVMECERLGWPVGRGDGWSDHDLEVLIRPRDRVMYLMTVTEYHADGWLTKLRVSPGTLPRELRVVVENLRG